MKRIILSVIALSFLGACGQQEPSEFQKWKGTYVYECTSGCEVLAPGADSGEGKIASMDGKYAVVFVDGDFEKNNIQINIGGGPYGDLNPDGDFEIESDNPTNKAGENAVRCKGSFTPDGREVMDISCTILDLCQDAADPECFEKTESCDDEGFHFGSVVTDTCGQTKYFKESTSVGPIYFKLICTTTEVGKCPQIE